MRIFSHTYAEFMDLAVHSPWSHRLGHITIDCKLYATMCNHGGYLTLGYQQHMIMFP